MTAAAAATINRLRAIAARLTKRKDPGGPWFAACLAEYEAGARHGLTLGDAFGFRLGAGQSSWWEQETLSRRDQLIRQIAAEHFSALSGRPAAAAIAKAIAGYERTAWRQHRAFAAPPAGLRGLRADLFRLLKLCEPIAEPTIRRVLGAGSRNPPFN
jgi:hypothetical protein